MTDLEITKACAEAMGLELIEAPVKGTPNDVCVVLFDPSNPRHYNPLHDDAQAMALVKRFRLQIDWSAGNSIWVHSQGKGASYTNGTDLNRAICQCVARKK